MQYASHVPNTYAQPTYAHQHSVHNPEHEDTQDIGPRTNGHDITCAQDIQGMDGHNP